MEGGGGGFSELFMVGATDSTAIVEDSPLGGFPQQPLTGDFFLVVR